MASASLPGAPEGWYVVEAAGEVDMYSAPALRDDLLKGINEGHRRVVLDLTDVTFIDSSGFAVLVTALKRLQQSEGTMRLAGAGEAVRSSMRISGIDRILTLYPDVEAAKSNSVPREQAER
jgi:anti-sigma B factor antagonist